jgi:hypothetical protein
MPDVWSAWRTVVVLVVGAAVAGVGSGAAAGVGTVVVREVVGEGPNGVGLVVQAPGVERRICVRFSGSTVSGADVLRRAGVDPVFSAMGAGLAVCAMCGVGCEGGSSCLTCQQPNYWSYWRATAGTTTFSYSPVGVSSVRAGHGDVEGWRFGTGDAAPTLVPFEQICTGMVVAGSPSTPLPTTLAPPGPGPTPAPDTTVPAPVAPTPAPAAPASSLVPAAPAAPSVSAPSVSAPSVSAPTAPPAAPTSVLSAATMAPSAPEVVTAPAAPSPATTSTPPASVASPSASSSGASSSGASSSGGVSTVPGSLPDATVPADAAIAVPPGRGGRNTDGGSGGAATAAGVAVTGVLVGGAALVGRSRRRAQFVAP